MSRRPRSFAPLVVLGTAALALLGIELAGLHFNLTASLPVGLYREVVAELDRSIELGELVALCPAPEWVRFARGRGYLPPGRCEGGGAPLLKRVVAIEGQVVTLDAAGVTVDGRWVQAPAPTTDHQGRSLAPLPPGRHTLTAGQLWLATSDPRSFDSRYFGPVHRDIVVATVVPLWTWAPAAVPRTSETPRSTP